MYSMVVKRITIHKNEKTKSEKESIRLHQFFTRFLNHINSGTRVSNTHNVISEFCENL